MLLPPSTFDFGHLAPSSGVDCAAWPPGRGSCAPIRPTDAHACNASSPCPAPCSSKFEQLVKPLLDRTVQVGGSHVVLSYHSAFATVWPLACYGGDRTTMHTLWARRPCCSQATPSPLHLAACISPRRRLVLPPLSVAQPCHNCMKDAGVQPADIQEVLMVGGMSRMPKVRGPALPLVC